MTYVFIDLLKITMNKNKHRFLPSAPENRTQVKHKQKRKYDL